MAKKFQVLIVLGSVSIWNEKCESIFRDQMRDVRILRRNSFPELADILVKATLAIVVVAVDSSDHLKEVLKEIKSARAQYQELSLGFILLFREVNPAMLDALSGQNFVLPLAGDLTPRAFVLKTQLQMVKMQAAQKKVGVATADYHFSAVASDSNRKQTADYVEKAQKSEDPKGVRFAEEPEGGKALNSNLTVQTGQSSPEGASEIGSTSSKNLSHSELSTEISDIKPICPDIFLISARPEDMQLAKALALSTKANLHHFMENTSDAIRFLPKNAKSIVLWDVNEESLNAIGPMLSQVISSTQVFGISDHGVNHLSYLDSSNRKAFAQTVFRKKKESGYQLYTNIIQAILQNEPFGLARYFRNPNKEQIIEIKHSKQRVKAVGAIQSFLTKASLPSRIARQIAQGVDELLLNAMFDAPIDSEGRHYKENVPQEQEFSMEGRESVTVSVMFDDQLFGISVKDLFGSLDIQAMLEHLSKNFRQENVKLKESGIGLNQIVDLGFSLLFAVKPKEMTEIFLFFPKVRSYKEFRDEFRFLVAIPVSNK